MPGASSGLMRLAQRSTVEREAALEHCELCGTPIPADHRHVLELATRDVKCACRPCGLLFERSDRMKLIPGDVRRVGDIDLGLPVEIVFCVRINGATKAFYPSPVGPTESLLAVDPGVELADDVEALLVNRGHAWIVGIDVCFALVGVVRTHWRGLTGGAEVRRELDTFFAGLDRRSRG
ncbi:DUF5947 family protein [Solirubrobacter ginsenosidimutans]|uniref:DUF5947 family protein n=1 Tax=Solirubrobacter ginsenosidimutans TaxID=490573 RepID=A0A9X3MY00_9ACTN|nr:DUF5947 family protein [Solirubrobacter ginsenosidimutans]MDA0164889.1 DUF5947 family protein [Solirubrobacter ginsenosidimutans]